MEMGRGGARRRALGQFAVAGRRGAGIRVALHGHSHRSARLLADLLELEPSHETFEPKFKVLKEQSEHHHKEEEENLFPKVRKLLDGAQREALGIEMLALQRKLDKAGEPRELVANQTDEAAPL